MSDKNGGHKTVVITGGGSGLGAASGYRILTDWPGVKVVAADLKIGDAAALQDEFGKDRVLFCEENVTTAQGAAKIVEAGVKFGGTVTGLVNCAGNSTNHSSLEMTPEQWREVLDCHLDGHFYMNQAVARQLVSAGQGGSIVNFSSIAHTFGWPRRLPYSVSKAGIDALTRTLAVEWAEFGIRVNAIAPGYINTQMVVAATAKGNIDPTIVGMHAMNRYGEPNEIATGVKFLLSDDASYITGEILTIDGGFTAKKIPWKK
jgi:NAD(P)-dependent dehydrogenase (short-subunit alcohol dehydrogenase family)